MGSSQRLDKIIEEAIVDAYDREEQLSGWGVLLEDKIKVPQACVVQNVNATLVKVEGRTCIIGRVRIDKYKLTVNVLIEEIQIGDKDQQAYIDAYKRWIYV